MEESKLKTSRFRIDKAQKELSVSKIMLDVGNPDASVNRSYYAIFHAMRAVLALDDFESKKHSGIISRFTHAYIKPKIFDVSFSEIIRAAFRVREYADYQDFYVATYEQAASQVKNAEMIVNTIQPYLQLRWAEMENE